VITNPEVSAVRDADRVIGILEAEEKHSPALVINRLNPELVKQHDMLSAEDVLDLLGIQLIGIVPEDEGVIVGRIAACPSHRIRRAVQGRHSEISHTVSREKMCRSWILINKAVCGTDSEDGWEARMTWFRRKQAPRAPKNVCSWYSSMTEPI